MITGGASRIGEIAGGFFAREGASVLLVDLSEGANLAAYFASK